MCSAWRPSAGAFVLLVSAPLLYAVLRCVWDQSPNMPGAKQVCSSSSLISCTHLSAQRGAGVRPRWIDHALWKSSLADCHDSRSLGCHATWFRPQAQRANAGGGGAARREALELMEASVKVGVRGPGEHADTTGTPPAGVHPQLRQCTPCMFHLNKPGSSIVLVAACCS